MKSLTNIMESNKYSVQVPEREYFSVVDYSSINEGNHQIFAAVNTDELESDLQDWCWSFKEYWSRRYSDSENILGYTKEQLTDWFANKSDKQIVSFLNTIKNLKPWTSAQFVINFPKAYIVVAVVTRIGLTGMNVKKQ